MVELLNQIKRTTDIFRLTNKYLRQTSKGDLTELKRGWAQEVLEHFNVQLEVSGKVAVQNEPMLLLGNHISYLDLPVLVNVCPEVSFVSKSEIQYWPVIGSAARAANTVFVKRENPVSRKSSRAEIESALIEENRKVVVFPSGTTAIGSTKFWRRGIFEVAEKLKVKVQPFRLSYSPLRSVAYIDDDFFPTHVFNLLKHPKIHAHIEFHEPVEITNAFFDCDTWQKWCEGATTVT